MGAPPWLRSGFQGASRVAPGLTSAVAAHLFRTTRRSKARPGERDVLRSATVSHIARMKVWSWGEGPTVLLVHGWNGRASQLGAFVEPLVSRGYRVVAFDAIGHGESAGSQSSLPEFANCIRQIVDELGGVYGIIAHSLGGAATTFALAYGLRAERLVFVSPPADPREFLKIFGAGLGISDEVRARVKERVERRLGIAMEDMQAFGLAPNMQLPLLVIHDANDKEVPVAVGTGVAESWPGAELIVTEGLGHQRILRDAGVRDSAVRFIDAMVASEHAA
jgi:pimeloyl-ACP methyl ester carboxylesterase